MTNWNGYFNPIVSEIKRMEMGIKLPELLLGEKEK